MVSRPPSQPEVDAFRRLGLESGRAALPVGRLLRVLNAGALRLSARLPDILSARRGRYLSKAESMEAARLIWEATDLAGSAVIAGHEEAQRHALRSDHELSDTFVNDVLQGNSGVPRLIEGAENAGIHLASPHFVTVVRMDDPGSLNGRLNSWLDAAIRANGHRSDLLVARHDDQVVIFAGHHPDAPEQVAGAVQRVLTCGPPGGTSARLPTDWRAGIGRPGPGLRGLRTSYNDARETLDLARLVAPGEQIIHIDRTLLARVLLRDRGAMADLVRAALAPLANAHGGAEPLVETLESYFAAGGTITDAAKGLHLSVRAVSYRLKRIHTLTGYNVNVPMDRLALQLAVMGARLLDWPRTPLPDGD